MYATVPSCVATLLQSTRSLHEKQLLPPRVVILLHILNKLALFSSPAFNTLEEDKALHVGVMLLNEIIGEPSSSTVATATRGPWILC